MSPANDPGLDEQPPEDGWFPEPIPVPINEPGPELRPEAPPDFVSPDDTDLPDGTVDEFAAFDEEARKFAEQAAIIDVPITGTATAGLSTPAWLHLTAPTPHPVHEDSAEAWHDIAGQPENDAGLLPSDPAPKPDQSSGGPAADFPSWIDGDDAGDHASAGVPAVSAPPEPQPLMPAGLDPVPIVPTPVDSPPASAADGLRLGGAAASPAASPGPGAVTDPTMTIHTSTSPAAVVPPPPPPPVAHAPTMPTAVAPAPTMPTAVAHAPTMPTAVAPAPTMPMPAVEAPGAEPSAPRFQVTALPDVPASWFSRILTWLIPLLLVAAAGATYLLARQGADEFLDSTGGKVEAAVIDPKAAGYAALVEPTPSMLMLWVDGLGNFSGASILSLAEDDVGGSVLIMPPFTQLRPGDDTLYAAYAEGGSDAVESALSRYLNLAFGQVETVDGGRWEDLLQGVDPFPIGVTDPLITRNESGEVGVRFDAGDSAIAAADVVDFLGWRNPDEVQLNQQFRHAQFWDVWITEVASGPDDVLPGESDAGIGRFVRGLAAGFAEINRLEFTEQTTSTVEPIDSEQTDASVPAAIIRVTPDEDQLRETILDMIPFPVAPFPGDRPRVRLLDGVGGPAATLAVAKLLVGEGAQIAILGNADRFDVEQTRIVFHGIGSESDAIDFGDVLLSSNIEGDFAPTPAPDALEPGEEPSADETQTDESEETPELQRTIDVTVVLGQDVIDELGL